MTKKGKVLVEERAPAAEPTLEHNRAKPLPLPQDGAAALLHAVGLASSDGTIKPAMQAKWAQVQEFLKLLEHTGELEKLTERPLQVVDCASGLAYLTFALYQYLTTVRGIETTITGVEERTELVEKSQRAATELGFAGLHFVNAPIATFAPPAPPHLVIALHACDTATDDALAQAIRWGSPVIIAVPCCQHDLNDQLKADLFRPVLRHGILQQRLADILTDALRAAILRIMGYRTEIIEFVGAEHTAKNVMIRAVKAVPPGDPQFVREYRELTAFWQVTPHLEKLLGPQLTELLA